MTSSFRDEFYRRLRTKRSATEHHHKRKLVARILIVTGYVTTSYSLANSRQHFAAKATTMTLSSALLAAAATLAPRLLALPGTVDGYAIHDVHRRDICGVWRLSSKKSFLPSLEDPHTPSRDVVLRPLKEFTVYPPQKRTPQDATIEDEEVLLMLSEDGSFVQYGAISPSDVAGDDDDDDEDEPEEKKPMPKFGVVRKTKKDGEEKAKGKSIMGLGAIKGTWDFIDGKLILASDRPEDTVDIRTVRDTMLVGNVVVREEESLADNPALPKSEGEEGGQPTETETSEKGAAADPVDATTAAAGKEQQQSGDGGGGSIDVHLSVPEGSVEIGKFMYPKTHPSFFEQPMIKPVPTGSFQLRQVLGTLNTRTDDENEVVEKFRAEDLMGKRYFMTSYPVQQKQKRGRKRWSIKQNKFVEDIKEKSDEEKKREETMPVPIRTMELELFPNMTFSTFHGFGSAKTLRGKWSVIGYDKDQFWMQISRFGFGRSVSGSTYSEGVGLTPDDEKAYWGTISEVGKGSNDEENSGKDHSPKSEEEEAKHVEMNGAVLDGLGLEPTTVAWFTMIEKTEGLMDDDDEDDDDDGDSDNDPLYFMDEKGSETDSADADDDEDDDIFSGLDAFQ